MPRGVVEVGADRGEEFAHRLPQARVNGDASIALRVRGGVAAQRLQPDPVEERVGLPREHVSQRRVARKARARTAPFPRGRGPACARRRPGSCRAARSAPRAAPRRRWSVRRAVSSPPRRVRARRSTWRCRRSRRFAGIRRPDSAPSSTADGCGRAAGRRRSPWRRAPSAPTPRTPAPAERRAARRSTRLPGDLGSILGGRLQLVPEAVDLVQDDDPAAPGGRVLARRGGAATPRGRCWSRPRRRRG